jgi:simple sugar transport system permease protein
VLAQIGLFRESIVSGQGFIALGIVIFGRWNPWKAAMAAIVFGACDALQLSLQLTGANIPPQLLLSLPYIVTILAISSLFGGKAIQPAALILKDDARPLTNLELYAEGCLPLPVADL